MQKKILLIISVLACIHATVVRAQVETFSLDNAEVHNWQVKSDQGKPPTITLKYTGAKYVESVSVIPALKDDLVSMFDDKVDGYTVLWSKFNIGATDPQSSGDYYAWGETEIKTYYSTSTYNAGLKGKYNTKNIPLASEDDVAYVKYNLFTPTANEWKMLLDKCVWLWTDSYDDTGEDGYIVYKKKEGENPEYTTKDTHIFLPANGKKSDKYSYYTDRGYYWSATLWSTGTDIIPYYLYFHSSVKEMSNNSASPVGFAIRPVLRYK